MASHGRKYMEAAAKVDNDKLYEPGEAFDLLKETSTVRFDASVEIAVKLGVNPKHADQMVRGSVVLPNGTGKTVRVVVFAKGEKVTEAEAAGADQVGGDDLAAKIQEGWLDFDVAVATPDMMSVVGRLGKLLGPRGLMPNPKAGTVTFDVADAVREIKAGKVEFRTEKTGIVHGVIGKASFDREALLQNFHTFIGSLLRVRPAATKGQYMRSITISTSMGPGIKISPSLAAKGVEQQAS